ncbi:acyl-CoA dehydrogenase family protein [Teredinibacter purpureus]|uniref:acyl-CoA dehydrogenase family protein n=1 Tax=Teredinibacter purpureus TaxID=2731756 RepID=UPI0005F7CFB8|nr:acyl-CoA dehydrogenase family protein [Teredinibacter purpureus]
MIVSSESIALTVREFVDQEIIPNELFLAKNDNAAQKLLGELRKKAQDAGLFGLFYPKISAGKFTSLSNYLGVAEQEGRSEYGPLVFGGEATLDAHMLHQYGNPVIREKFLAPMAAGDIIAGYAMTEPEACGSVPATLHSSATLINGHWIVNGRKWFICRADRASFVTVVARTNPCATIDQAFSMIVVPVATPGCSIDNHIKIFGQYRGQAEISFNKVSVPEDYLLGKQGLGLSMIGQRLNLGRILRSAQWIGLAQRCFDLMCERIGSPRGVSIMLADKQLIRQHVFNAYKAIASARALMQAAAQALDSWQPSDIAVNMAKVAASQALNLAADSAIQVFGAEGVSDRTPLASIFQIARTTRILDGADETLISSLGRRILASHPSYRVAHSNANVNLNQAPIYYHDNN